MPPKKPQLRAVEEGETATPPKRKTVTAAAADGDRRELLVALRTRIAKTVEDPNCPARDLAALSRRLLEIAKEIEAIDSTDRDDAIGQAAATPDDAWDESAI
ncbi:hypothetical protein [Nocardia sp. NPDC019255]|uniref:hypothetical protein n=1 Tax=Nocardia sp. NPDC019255 TaxID=3154591 RepID=UPI0033D48C89